MTRFTDRRFSTWPFIGKQPSVRRTRRRSGNRQKPYLSRLQGGISLRRGNVELLEARTLLSAAPTVATGAATSVSTTGATLEGTVNAQGGTATAAFQYSTSPTFTPAVARTVASGFTPGGVAADASGNVFVADWGNNAVKKVSPDGSIQTIGSGFSAPAGVAVDSSGDVFVADWGNNAVKKVSPDGSIQTIGSGFSAPTGVAVDASGDVFVADWGNGAVKEVLPDGTIKPISSGFVSPVAVAVDASGDVFVASSSAVNEVMLDGTIKTIGSGFSDVDGVAVDASGDVFLTEYHNNAVTEILPNGSVQTVGSGFSALEGVAADAFGDVFVTDTGEGLVELSPPTVSATPSPVNGSTATAISATLTGLTPGTTYYYRAEAADGATVVDAHSPPASFTTAGGLNGATGASASGGVEGVSAATLSGATFTDTDTTAPASDFSISSVDWGDHSGAATGLSISGAGGNYTVTGAHVYAEEANYDFTIVVEDAAGSLATISGSADVADAALTAGSITPPVATEGVAFGPLTVFHFSDANANAASADFTATVETGDATLTSSADPQQVSIVAANGGFDVKLSYTYAGQLTGKTFAVAVADKGGKTAASSVSNFSVAGQPLAATPASLTVSLNASTTLAVATFTDRGGAQPAADYAATIDWGDGKTTADAPISVNAGTFTVSGTHAYAEQGVQSPVVAISRAGATVSVTASVTVNDAPLDVTPATLTPIKGVSGTFGVATFTDPGGAQSPGEYSATIDWGDGGGATNAAISVNAGTFTVSGAHAYQTTGTMAVVVNIDHGGAIATVTSQATVAPAVNLLGNFGLVEDIYTIGSGTVSVPAANGVLANDSAPSALTVNAGTVTGANGGKFTFGADGSFTYTPLANFPGFDYAKYAATDAQGDAAQATVNVLSQKGGVVWKFYESVLGRYPDYVGLQYWINDFVHGGMTGDIAVGFFESDELLNKIIGEYYKQYLGRTLDQAGLDFWKRQWRATGGPELIKAGFAASQEFNDKAGNTTDGWLSALYLRILNRAPDPQGYQFWRQQLAAGASEFDVALGFFDSTEAYQNDVIGWFNEYLRRAPTSAELQHYANEMTNGKTDRDIEQEITNLPEYGQEPPPAAAGTADRLPDYFQPYASASGQQQVVAAKDNIFTKLGA